MYIVIIDLSLLLSLFISSFMTSSSTPRQSPRTLQLQQPPQNKPHPASQTPPPSQLHFPPLKIQPPPGLFPFSTRRKKKTLARLLPPSPTNPTTSGSPCYINKTPPPLLLPWRPPGMLSLRRLVQELWRVVLTSKTFWSTRAPPPRIDRSGKHLEITRS